MSDRELLEMAAKAAGYKPERFDDEDGIWLNDSNPDYGYDWWNPLEDDGDALRLAVTLDIDIFQSKIYREVQVGGAIPKTIFQPWGLDKQGNTRLAIVLAAAEIGKSITDQPLSGK